LKSSTDINKSQIKIPTPEDIMAKKPKTYLNQEDVSLNDIVNNMENSEINLKSNLKLSDYLLEAQNADYKNNLSKFTNAFYKKFKKVFLIHMDLRSRQFIPTSDINARQNLID